jgi:hypothetical protein
MQRTPSMPFEVAQLVSEHASLHGSAAIAALRQHLSDAPRLATGNGLNEPQVIPLLDEPLRPDKASMALPLRSFWSGSRQRFVAWRLKHLRRTAQRLFRWPDVQCHCRHNLGCAGVDDFPGLQVVVSGQVRDDFADGPDQLVRGVQYRRS